jgi:hypothetical protein
VCERNGVARYLYIDWGSVPILAETIRAPVGSSRILKANTNMFRNGIYKVCYRSLLHDEGTGEHSYASVRDGHIIGSDRLGAVFAGTGLSGGAGDGRDDVFDIELTIPPGGELITGLVAGPCGATLKLQSRLDPGKLSQFAVVDVAGSQVEIMVSYLGPLPE